MLRLCCLCCWQTVDERFQNLISLMKSLSRRVRDLTSVFKAALLSEIEMYQTETLQLVSYLEVCRKLFCLFPYPMSFSRAGMRQSN